MSRMSYANIGPENLQRLHRLLIDAINSLIEKVFSGGRCFQRGHIRGSNRWQHGYAPLFPGPSHPLPVLLSFTPVITRSYSLEAREAGLKINRRGKVTVLPVIAGYVGADAVADALAIGLIEKEKTFS